MKYLFALIGDQTRLADATPEEMRAFMQAWDGFTRAAKDAGVYLGGEGLQPPTTATTEKILETGDRSLNDGPFAETKEQLACYYLLDCEDLDEALAWAKRIPWIGGSVEVRPVMDYEAAGSREHTNRAQAEGLR